MDHVSTLLSVPIPILIGATVPQSVPYELLPDLPGWATTALLALWVAFWLLDKMGKLPGTSKADEADERLVRMVDELSHDVRELKVATTELRIELAGKKNG